MKKPIFIIAAVCAAAAFFGGCQSCNSEPTDNKKGGYEALNDLLALDYSGFKLTVTDTFDAETSLKSEYVVEYSANGATVNYSIERFAEISLGTPVSSAKVTLEGVAVIKDGVVVSVDGDDVNITADAAETGLNFKEEYFENARLTGINFNADVKNSSGFLGADITCTEMKVQAYFPKALDNIKITYKADGGNRVEYVYKFTI